MRRFTINDLTITLGDTEGEPAAEAAVGACPFNSCGWTIVLDPPCGSSVACGGCTLRVTACGPVTDCGRTACHPAVTNTKILTSYSAEDLGMLKGELERELAEIDAHVAALAPSTAPQTPEEIEELERKLSQALEELRRHKGEHGRDH